MDTTHEPELHDPVDLCDPSGRRLDPAAMGWSRQPLHRANLRGARWRTKKWDYWAVLAGDLAIGLVYADVGYVGLATMWWGELDTGHTGGRDLVRPLSRGITLPDVPGSAPLRVDDDRLSMRLSDDEAGTSLSVRWTDSADSSPGELDVLVERPPGHESLSVVIPWGESRFQFTTKDQARPARGVLRRGDREDRIGDDGDAWGVLDVGRGRWPYSIRWNWGGGAGRAGTGEVVGVQFGARWTEGTGFTENAITIDGRLLKLGRELEWSYDWDHPMRPWRVRDAEGALDLTLTPRHDCHSLTNAVALRMEVHQVFGTWSGTVRAADGTVLQLDGIQGFAEEARNRW
ncbi:MAG: DUF2804 domain-containing protein [Microthrixaceae bacterium]